ncbi:MAG TPA: Holliday junction branch migration protein RuvA [Candidatus Saccharibacteria bacterium]|nr:Holliday junction branch migration protein RuvA [Candidatus Saccharibacteria bacterium]
MISTLSGIVSEKFTDSIVVDVNGVGYGLLVTVDDYAKLALDEKAKLYVYEHIREASHDLFGFSRIETKQLFEQLLSVKNVGPKVALAVLDIGSGDYVRSAIAAGEVKTLQTAKGVGKRAAEQIVVELRDKVGIVAGTGADDIINRGSVNQSDEAVQALVALGYQEIDAQLALQNIDKDLSTEERIKQALKGVR